MDAQRITNLLIEKGTTWGLRIVGVLIALFVAWAVGGWQLRVHVKTEDFWAVHERVVRATKRALDEAKIGIPFPQQDVHFDADALSGLHRSS